jgi:hypothetical protein
MQDLFARRSRFALTCRAHYKGEAGRRYSISFDRQAIDDAVNLHEDRGCRTPEATRAHMFAASVKNGRAGEYDVSETINAWRAMECGGIVGDRHRVEVRSRL